MLALQNDKNITLVPTYKGNATVVLLSEDYHNKIKTILSSLAYTKLTVDPTREVESNTFSKKEVRHPRRSHQGADTSQFGSTQPVWAAKDL
jgi:hypothetical protein